MELLTRSATRKAQAQLADRFALEIVDRRGLGDSSHTESEDFEADARDIAGAPGDGALFVAVMHNAADQLSDYYANHQAASARAFLVGFFELMGLAAALPDPLPARLVATTPVLMRCRRPWTADFPLTELARAPFRSLIVSGGHAPVFESICGVLARFLLGSRPQR